MQTREIRRDAKALTMHGAEFSVFSQFGEDGIIQWLLAQMGDVSDSFVELGVGDYRESNTRLLAQAFGWRGLIIDGDKSAMRVATSEPWFETRDVTALCSFVTTESVNDIVATYAHDVGLLSIDLDGVDFWIWRAMTLRPAIVVIEYNARFGAERSVTVPYSPDFVRGAAHHSHTYFGASLEALTRLGRKKGYVLAGCTSSGVNAFFVRADVAPVGIATTTQSAFRSHRHREHRDASFNLTYMDPELEAEALTGMPLVTVGPDGEPQI